MGRKLGQTSHDRGARAGRGFERFESNADSNFFKNYNVVNFRIDDGGDGRKFMDS